MRLTSLSLLVLASVTALPLQAETLRSRLTKLMN